MSFVLKKSDFHETLFIIKCTGVIAVSNELRNIFKCLDFRYNAVSISRDKLHNQKLLGILSHF